MQTKSITWPKHTDIAFQGRNGTGFCCGVEVRLLYTEDADGGLVDLLPITSRGCAGNCSISIPVAQLQKVIAALAPIHKSHRPKKRR